MSDFRLKVQAELDAKKLDGQIKELKKRNSIEIQSYWIRGAR